MGLEIVYDNRVEKNESWRKYFLLQAKRIKPNSHPATYSETSAFTAVNTEQEERIKLLKERVGHALKHLLYCPRPENLLPVVAQKLNYYRTLKLTSNIFDYVTGQELREDLKNGGVTTAAELFIADEMDKAKNLKEVHEHIFEGSIPFSWFIAGLFAEEPNRGIFDRNELNADEQEFTRKILQGDSEVQKVLSREFSTELKNVPENFTIYPAHTLTVRFSIGESLEDGPQ